MKVKAKWNVKDGSGWHSAGEVFETESDLCDAVEILDAPKKQESAKKAEPEKEEKPAEKPAEKEPEAKPKTATRRRTSK